MKWMHLMLKAVLSLSALLASTTALADIELGAHSGLNMIMSREVELVSMAQMAAA